MLHSFHMNMYAVLHKYFSVSPSLSNIMFLQVLIRPPPPRIAARSCDNVAILATGVHATNNRRPPNACLAGDLFRDRWGSGGSNGGRVGERGWAGGHHAVLGGAFFRRYSLQRIHEPGIDVSGSVLCAVRVNQ